MEIALSLIYFSVFSLLIGRGSFFKDSIIPRSWFIIIFGIKIIFSIILTAIYTHYYSNRDAADIYRYFDDSKVMFDALKNHPFDYFKMLFGVDNNTSYFDTNYYYKMSYWYRENNSNLFSDSHIIIRFNAFVRMFSFGYFQVHNIFINFISLIGLTAIFSAFRGYFSTTKKLLFYIVFLIPSVLFWGSGLLKEGILLFALGLLINSTFKLTTTFQWKNLIIVIFSLLLIIYTKFYIIAVVALPIIGFIVYQKIWKGKVLLSYGITFVILISLTFTIKAIYPHLNPIQILINKQADFLHLLDQVKAGSAIDLPIIKDGYTIIKYTPNALLNTFVRPFIWESNSPLLLLNAIENVVILLFILGCIVFAKKKFDNSHIILFCIFLVVGLYVVIGLTTPVFGAIARYKVPGLPFLLIAFLALLDAEKLKTRLPFLKHLL